jgi:uncharacterized membrane protein
MRPFPRETVTAGQRLLVLAGLGLVATLIALVFAPWQIALIIGWDVSAAIFLLNVWVTLHSLDASETQRVSTIEDNSRVLTHLFLVSAAVASLVGAGFALAKANDSDGVTRAVLGVFGVLTVVVSWATVHAVFALRYAHEYYTPPVGGIDFKNEAEDPDYHDFAYVAFVIGMTFQVADTDIQSKRIRRTVLKHALLSYLFGAVILAVTVNVIANVLF